MLNKVIIGLGSNQDKEKNMAHAVRLLHDHFVSIRFSEAVYTEPVNMQNPSLFLNQIAVAFTEEEPDEIVRFFKLVEKQLGRMPEDKQKENILIDIDLLQWNDRVLKPQDIQRPYIQSALLMFFNEGQEDEGSKRQTGSAGTTYQ